MAHPWLIRHNARAKAYSQISNAARTAFNDFPHLVNNPFPDSLYHIFGILDVGMQNEGKMLAVKSGSHITGTCLILQDSFGTSQYLIANLVSVFIVDLFKIIDCEDEYFQEVGLRDCGRAFLGRKFNTVPIR